MTKQKLTKPQRDLLLRFKWRWMGTGKGLTNKQIVGIDRLPAYREIFIELIRFGMVEASYYGGDVTQKGLDYLEEK